MNTGIKFVDDLFDSHCRSPLDECELECVQLSGGLVFKRDFGPWEKDYVADCIVFNFAEGHARQFNSNGDILVECPIDVVAVHWKKP